MVKQLYVTIHTTVKTMLMEILNEMETCLYQEKKAAKLVYNRIPFI